MSKYYAKILMDLTICMIQPALHHPATSSDLEKSGLRALFNTFLKKQLFNAAPSLQLEIRRAAENFWQEACILHDNAIQMDEIRSNDKALIKKHWTIIEPLAEKLIISVKEREGAQWAQGIEKYLADCRRQYGQSIKQKPKEKLEF